MFQFATNWRVAGLAILLACSGESTPSGPGGNPPPPPPPPPNTVEVLNNFFNPVSLAVPVGTTVTWDWPTFSRRHNVLPEGGGSVPYSPNIVDGPYVYSYTFSQAGIFDYYCLEHGGMRGTIVVQ
ncbi:MAG: plastocyanin/azurin family copper-binding protein [Gemmatimonadales bacterium]